MLLDFRVQVNLHLKTLIKKKKKQKKNLKNTKLQNQIKKY